LKCIQYRFFFSKLEHSFVTFDGLHITLTELKKKIMAKEHLKAPNYDEVEIPRHSSVIVRRTPAGGVGPGGKPFIVYIYYLYIKRLN
uniref:DWNN domain-containing protein n=1 Tax=Gouania willdenowi TaxID=441366 RepID=A0A8C5H247_GOUWI